MTDQPAAGSAAAAHVTVHYWAAAKAAAGVDTEQVAALTLADLLDQIVDRHREQPRFGEVIDMCSILIGETPVGAREPRTVRLRDGDTIEFLPPFAGG